jgi:creatinine deaminase
MFTTLSPCPMCVGTIILYGIARVVVGDNTIFTADEDYLRKHGIEVVNLHDSESEKLMNDFIAEKPDIWFVDSAGHSQT